MKLNQKKEINGPYGSNILNLVRILSTSQVSIFSTLNIYKPYGSQRSSIPNLVRGLSEKQVHFTSAYGFKGISDDLKLPSGASITVFSKLNIILEEFKCQQ